MPRKKKVDVLQKELVEITESEVPELPRQYTLRVENDSLAKIVAKRNDALPEMIDKFVEENVKIKYDKNGNEVNDTNPFLVSTYFFKPINPAISIEPIYSAEQLTIVYDLYCRILEEVNMKVMTLQPTLSHFTKFAGMSLDNLRSMRYGNDISLRLVAEKIYNDIFDANVTLSQHKKLDTASTTLRMKIENEAIEKKQPNVNVNVNTKTVDLDKIENRLAQIKNLNRRMVSYEENYE